MAAPAIPGEAWSDDELDLIVADYFAMLSEEQARRTFVKARHNAALRSRIARTRGSVERKHMNISAVLEELGLPRIDGYQPLANYQRSIFDAIDRYLTRHPAAFALAFPDPVGLAETPALFAHSPPELGAARQRDPALERLVRKFDPAERDLRNRALGRAGEALIVEFERRRLTGQDRPDLARKVRWISEEDGDGAGYDILSFAPTGAERLIEVKTTRGVARTPFFLTRNEHALSQERPEAFRLCRLYKFSNGPQMFELRPPLDAAVHLSPMVFSASFD